MGAYLHQRQSCIKAHRYASSKGLPVRILRRNLVRTCREVSCSIEKAELTLSPDQVELAYRKVPTLPERVSTNVRRSGLASRQASWLVLAIN
jgi:hypothetical protein